MVNDDPPDLLHPEPLPRPELPALEKALDFAFASGGAYTELEDCLDRAKVARSSWDPSCFDKDLFLDDLVERCFPIVIGGASITPNRTYLGRLISHPPDDRRIARHRQAILAELTEQPHLRKSVERLYLEIRKLVELVGPKEAHEGDAIDRRRIEALDVARRIIDLMAEGFEGARSGLDRLTALGQRIKASEAYGRLASLLELEGHLAGLDVRLRVGRDGSLRAFEIVRWEENRQNPLYQTPFRRLVRKLRQMLRGYKYTDDEVFEALVDGVFRALRPDLVKLFLLQGDLEVYLAALGFRDQAMDKGLAVSLPALDGDGGNGGAARSLEGLFNPLLLAEEHAPIPCSLAFRGPEGIAIFTGPNSGGKTRVLQAVAVAQMLGQAGLFVPAESARLAWADGLFVSLIGDARSDQREGRLGMELLRIRSVFERLRPGGLVLLDELCSGTNPSEGEEIFELVVSLLGELSPQAFITTHFLDFAARLRDRHRGEARTGELSFFQVELDEHQEPTYQFVPGVAKSSLASKTAARLGVTREDLEALVAKNRRTARGQREQAAAREPAEPLASAKPEGARVPIAGQA